MLLLKVAFTILKFPFIFCLRDDQWFFKHTVFLNEFFNSILHMLYLGLQVYLLISHFFDLGLVAGNSTIIKILQGFFKIIFAHFAKKA